MAFFLQSLILCALFTLVIWRTVGQNPMQGILSYPPAIRRRLESLPQYQGILPREKRIHLNRKIFAVLLIVLILAAADWFSGKRGFAAAFLHGMGLFTVANLWDLVVLDWIWFCHSPRFRLPGTEDMETVYLDPWFHLRSFGKGCVIGLVLSLLAAGLVALLGG